MRRLRKYTSVQITETGLHGLVLTDLWYGTLQMTMQFSIKICLATKTCFFAETLFYI